jgi:hypothetical protein
MDKSKNPPTHLGSCRYLTLCRGVLDFVHHSIAIVEHQAPNPNLTIRDFSIAERGQRVEREHHLPGPGSGCGRLPRDPASVTAVASVAASFAATAAARATASLSTSTSPTAVLARYDQKVANREMWVWHFVMENGN